MIASCEPVILFVSDNPFPPLCRVNLLYYLFQTIPSHHCVVWICYIICFRQSLPTIVSCESVILFVSDNPFPSLRRVNLLFYLFQTIPSHHCVVWTCYFICFWQSLPTIASCEPVILFVSDNPFPSLHRVNLLFYLFQTIPSNHCVVWTCYFICFRQSLPIIASCEPVILFVSDNPFPPLHCVNLLFYLFQTIPSNHCVVWTCYIICFRQSLPTIASCEPVTVDTKISNSFSVGCPTVVSDSFQELLPRPDCEDAGFRWVK